MDTAKDTMRFQTKKNKEWLSEDTWKKIEKRQDIKQKILNSGSTRIQEQLKSSYKTKNREVKRNAGKNRRDFIDAIAREAEEAANMDEMTAVFKIINQLCGTTRSLNTQFKDKYGNILTNEEEQAKRWVEHCKEGVKIHSKPNTR